MTSELKVDKITPASGTNTQIGEAGDTTNLSAGTVTTSIITGQSAKTSLADADKFLISDSAASGAFKYVESQYIGGGGLIRLGGTTGSGLSGVTHDGIFTSTYENYRIIGSHTMGTNNTQTRMVMRKSGTEQDGNYRYVYGEQSRTSSSSGSSRTSEWDGNIIELTAPGSSYSAGHTTAIDLLIFSPKDATKNTIIFNRSSFYYPSNSHWYFLSGSVWVDGADGLNNDGFKIYPQTGTLDNVKYSIYGIVDS